MLLPVDPKKRAALYRNLIRECEVSRPDRRAQAQRLRLWALTGGESGQRVRYNKLWEHIDYAASYIYGAETLKFGVVLPPRYGDQWIEEEAVAGDEIHRLWHDSDAGLTAAKAAKWAFVYPTMVGKVITDNNEPVLTLVPDPSDIGVLRESVDEWDRQEAICHWYALDVPAFRRMIANHPRAAELIVLAEEHAFAGRGGQADTIPSAVQNLVLAQSTPRMIGAVQNLGSPVAMAREAEPTVELAELWIWDDEKENYRVVKNFLATETIIGDPVNPLLPGRHPFYPLCLEPVPGYLWGVAPLEQLLLLQQWRTERMEDIDFLMKKQLRPPLFGSGIAGILEEKIRALRNPDGVFVNPMPGADVKPVLAPMPPDAFTEIHEIDRMFDHSGGLPSGMRGEAQPGVRSGEQVVAQALIGAGPTLARAMLMEDWIESVATAMLRLRLRTSATVIEKSSGQKFLLSQMPDDFVVRVSGHSASPIYAQQTFQKAILLKREGVLDGEMLIRLSGIPMEDIARAKQRELAKSQARILERKLEIAEETARAKMEKARR